MGATVVAYFNHCRISQYLGTAYLVLNNYLQNELINYGSISQSVPNDDNFRSHWRETVTLVLYQSAPVCREEGLEQNGVGALVRRWLQPHRREIGVEAWTAYTHSVACTQCPTLCIAPNNPRILESKEWSCWMTDGRGYWYGADFNRVEEKAGCSKRGKDAESMHSGMVDYLCRLHITVCRH